MIVYLHGGPAAPDTMVMYTFADQLMDSFTFVGWDQRGAGRTYYRNRASDPNNRTATFASALSDLDELVDYVRERFGKEKIILMGHSYGTILGSQYVLAHPEKVADYIAVGQVVSTPDGDLLSYQDALEKARLAGDDTRDMEEACETFIADRTLWNMLQLRQYVSPYHRAAKEANTLWQGISSPYFGIDDFRWFLMQAFDVDAYLSLNQQLFDAIMTYRAMDKGLSYEVPVYFISGAEDWICPVELIETYMERISAPEKSLSLIPESGHAPQTDSPEDFVQVVREVLK